MTQLEAFKQAQETGQIAITKGTASILEAFVRFREDAYTLANVIEENKPAEASSLDKYFDLFYPLDEYVLASIGELMLQGALIYRSDKDCKFEGL